MTEGGALGKAGVRRAGVRRGCGVYILFKTACSLLPFPRTPILLASSICFWKSRSVLVRVLFMPRTPRLRC